MDNQEIFQTLNEKNVNDFTQKKGAFTYLSWAWAVRELLEVAPDATWEVHKWGGDDDVNSRPYMENEVNRTQIHPVLNHKNQTIEKPNAFEINTSIQRCLAKAIALHGLGLYIYAGEDLPIDDPVSPEEQAELVLIAAKVSPEMEAQVSAGLDSGNINRSNYGGSLAKLERLAKEKTNEKSK